MEEKKISKLAQSVLDAVTNKVPAPVLSDVVADWQSHFSELKRYKSGQKLLKIAGPVAFGIELEKFLSNEYRPRVVLYNLINNSSKLIAVIDQTIKNKKGVDISIEYSEHAKKFQEACTLLERQSRVSLFGKPTTENIIRGIIAYVENDMFGNCFWSCQAVMQLSRLMEDEQKKDAYFEKGIELLRNKVPAQLLDMQTKGTEKWIADIRNLDAESINTAVKESLRKYKMEDIPQY